MGTLVGAACGLQPRDGGDWKASMPLQKVTRVSALGGYRIYVEFEDGTAGQIDLSDRLFGPVFEPLRDESEFHKLTVDGFGAVA